jgi:hypothetical protein
MHQQPRAIEQPLALKIVSRSGQRSGVRGATESFIGLASGAKCLDGRWQIISKGFHFESK